ncbi:MAG: sugar ABC transporter permease [Cyanobacteria bacterium P01_H01_bin.74]
MHFFHKIKWTETHWATFFILPCLLGLLVFTYLPILGSLGLSFSYWNLLGTPKFVGFLNYQTVFNDPLFWQSLLTTVFFVLMTALLEVSLGLALAVWLNGIVRFQSFFQATYFLPYITPMVSVALVWGWVYDPANGVLNWLLKQLQIIDAPVAWLYNEKTALWAVIVLGLWKSVGYTMIIFLTSLQSVPGALEEAGKLDGAGAIQQFFLIILPSISPTVFFVSTMVLIQGFQVFDSVYLLTQGGPAHHTELLVYWMFKNAFEFYKVGEASAIAYILFLLIFAITLVQWIVRKKWVLHED